MVNIKNVILYDHYQHVVGFVELKNFDQMTDVHVKHNLDEEELILSVTAGGANHAFRMEGKSFSTAIKQQIDVTEEVVVAIIQRQGEAVVTVASGVINPEEPFKLGKAKDGRMPLAEPLQEQIQETQAVGALKSILNETKCSRIDRHASTGYSTNAAREIDEVLRAVCTIGDNGKGLCESCPYREFFYGDNIDGEPINPLLESLNGTLANV